MWIFLSHMTIQQDPTNLTPSTNKPHGRGLLARLTWSCFRQIFEITENDQNIYKSWIDSPDDYLYTGISLMDWIELFYVLWAILWKTCQLTPLSQGL